MGNEDKVKVKESVSFFSFEPFDSSKSTWSRWVKRFKTALELYECQSAKHQRLLLHFVGTQTYNILCDKILPKVPEDMNFDEIVTILGEHYDPKPNELLENFRFNLRKQKADETCAEFAVALRRLAVGCNFGAHLDVALRNQFVFGLLDSKIQHRLLEKKTLKIEDAINMATAYELAEKGGEELQQKNTDKVYVNKVFEKKKKGDTDKKRTNCGEFNKNKPKCFRCGSTAHLADKCQYIDSKCHFCKKKGHLRKMCFKNKKQEQLNQIEETTCGTVEDLFKIESKGDLCNLRNKLLYNFMVNDKLIEFELDSGSPVALMNCSDAKKILPPKTEVYKSDLELSSFCEQQLIIVGYVYVNVKINNQNLNVRLYIVKSNRKPLCGREWLRQLTLDWNKVFSTTDKSLWVNQIEQFHVNDFKVKYPNVFSPSVGKIKDLQARIYVKQNATPKFLRARRVPFPLMEAVEKQLEKQVADGLLVKVDTSEWATPIVVVPKKNGDVRICGDYKVTLNPALLIDEHPLPTIDELFSKMAGGTKFSKIDLSKAYLQLEVHPSDRHLLTLSTHKGLYQPTRLMFGVASAPAKWQRLMEQLLCDIPGVSVFLDDIKITAPDDESHMRRIDEVLKRLEKYNMRVNLEKSEFLKECITYCGYVINKDGVKRMQSKIDAIQQMKKPASKDDVRAFMGLINYYGRFVKNLSDIVYPLNRLLQNEVPFDFDEKCVNAFNEIKKQMQSETILAHYDPKQPVVLAVDASPIGVGAVLSHVYKDGTERPVQFASQTLNKVQQRYSQIDKEAYAVIFGIRKFYQYLYGRKFTLVTDNRAISQIFSPSKGLSTLSSTRMQHYALYLEQFDYTIKCKRSKENSNADAMSRLPNSESYKFTEEVYFVEGEYIDNLPVTANELKIETKADDEVQKLIECLKYGRNCDSKYRFGIPQLEFSLHDGCLLRGMRVYIPKTLRKKVLDELHTAHFGMSRMKSLARAYVWWNNLDKDIEKLVTNCFACQSTRPDPKKVMPIRGWATPSKPFERVHADYAGPVLGKYLFVLVDAYTKWPEVRVVSNMTTETTIQECREIFSTFGTPNVFVSDHGRQFDSAEFKNFLNLNGIIHKQGAPYHPATNGQAERYVQTIKQKLLAAKCTANTLNAELSKILLAYRRSIHPATGKSPSMAMFNRQINSRLDLLLPQNNNNYNFIETTKTFSVGEKVAVRDYLYKTKWRFGVIDERLGELHYNVKLNDGRIWKRHVDQMRKVGEMLQESEQQENVNISNTPPNNQLVHRPVPNIYHDVSPTTELTMVSYEQECESNEDAPDIATTTTTTSDADNVPLTSDAIPDEAVGENIRRSNRERKKPMKLIDEV